MSTQEILEAAVNKLKGEYGNEYDIQLHPDSVNGFTPTHPVASVLISYEGSPYGKPQGIQQSKLMELEAIVVARSLNTTQLVEGMYDVVDKVRAGLTKGNFLSSRLYCASERFMQAYKGYWYYSIRFMYPTTTYWGT